jgi:hypothetical protein
MDLRPHDVLVALKLAVDDCREWQQRRIADDLGISAGELSKSLQRLRDAQLVSGHELRTLRSPFLEFVKHGLRYVLPVKRRGVVRGLPTAYAAAPLRNRIMSDGVVPPVWADPDGTVSGEAWEPLSKSAVGAAKRSERMYQGLALLDALRGGKARERELAGEYLRELTK